MHVHHLTLLWYLSYNANAEKFAGIFAGNGFPLRQKKTYFLRNLGGIFQNDNMCLLTLAIATITKAAAYHRVLFQVINEKCSTVAHFHSSLPKAAVVFPVKANCSGNFSFRWVFWMRTPQPAGSVRPAMLDGNTFISHHGACFASKAIPSLWYIQNVHVTFSSSGPVKPLSAARPPEGNVVTRQTWILFRRDKKYHCNLLVHWTFQQHANCEAQGSCFKWWSIIITEKTVMIHHLSIWVGGGAGVWLCRKFTWSPP